MFIATTPPREEPTITSGRCRPYSTWAVWTASSKSASSRAGLDDLVAVLGEKGRLEAARVRVSAVEEEDFHVVFPGIQGLLTPGVVCLACLPARPAASRPPMTSAGPRHVGTTEGSSLPTLYIGERDPVKSRLNPQFSEKDFWN